MNFFSVTSNIIIVYLFSAVILLSQEYIPFRDQDNNWGYKDKEGRVVIEPQFGDARKFENGLAVVASRKDGLLGVINTEGRFIAEPKYHDISPFCNGYAVVQYGSNLGPANKIKKGIIDQNGVEVIKPRYLHAEACPLPGGWFKVQPHNNTFGDWHFANLDGRESKKLPEEISAPVTGTPYEVKYKQRTLILQDKKFKLRKEVEIPAPQDYEIIKTEWISDRLLLVKCEKITPISYKHPLIFFYKTDLNLGGGGLLERSGMVLKVKEEEFKIFKKHNAILLENKQLFNSYGDFKGYLVAELSPQENYSAIAFSNNPDKKDAMWEIINKDGKTFTFKYNDLTLFDPNIIVEINGGMFTFYDIQQAKAIASFPSYDESFIKNKMKESWHPLKYSMYNNDAYPVIVEDGKWVFVNHKAVPQGQAIKADLLLPLMKKAAPFSLNNKWGLIAKDGTTLAPAVYDSLSFDGKTYQLYDYKFRKTYNVTENGILEEVKISAPANPSTSSNERRSTCTCLIYSFKNPDLNYDNKAYILVDLCYYPDQADHTAMARWVKNAIGSEIQSLWTQGYYRVNEAWNNVYEADLLRDRSCYFYESEFKMKFSKVLVFKKNFY
jgi:hypothetical protein